MMREPTVVKKLIHGILMLGWIPTLGRIALDIGLADGATLPR
jgi:hypothetical protein